MTMRCLAIIALPIVVASALGSVGCGTHQDAEAPPTTLPAPTEARGIAPLGVETMPDSDLGLANLPELVAGLGLAPYHRRGHRGQGLRIAVLDNGFGGLAASRGVRLPPGVKVAPAPRPEMAPTNHGTKLAEIAYAVATGETRYDATRAGPEILLFNTNGYSNFRDALVQVAAADVDLVLYAQIWEYGGNADGRGFINREVGRVLESGALWVNAAGNLGNSTYGGPVRLRDNGDVALPHQERYVRFVVAQDVTPVKIVLAWNDFDESKDYRTPQDLDLALEDAAGRELAAGRLVQSGDEGTGYLDYSAHAREIVQATLDAGIYRLRVEAASRNFDAASRLRLTADGVGVRFLDAGPADDVVLMPADNPRVLTVGAADVAYTSRAGGKPELDVVSAVSFAGGARRQGTSAAAALAVGALAVFRSAHGALDHAAVVDGARRGLLAGPKPASCMGAGCATPVLKLKDLWMSRAP